MNSTDTPNPQFSSKADKMAVRRQENKQKRDANRERRDAGRQRLEEAKDAARDRLLWKANRHVQHHASGGRWQGGTFGAENVYTDDDRAFYDAAEEEEEDLDEADAAQPRVLEVALGEIVRPAKKRGGRRREGAQLTNGQMFEVVDEDVFSVKSLEEEGEVSENEVAVSKVGLRQ
ncbi:hypothetical protein FA95DRAFT_758618 [Auriscalpium vulgare]|uniref:Uncharacterized protein n=1 Tax=Auriscalpium vulgare TaxID=40419 RepID=A0ACB8S0W1_9AGAM|nr:hypothetical protein FA95DRAFT_758618 [Auriscalpium vulgare]